MNVPTIGSRGREEARLSTAGLCGLVDVSYVIVLLEFGRLTFDAAARQRIPRDAMMAKSRWRDQRIAKAGADE